MTFYETLTSYDPQHRPLNLTLFFSLSLFLHPVKDQDRAAFQPDRGRRHLRHVAERGQREIQAGGGGQGRPGRHREEEEGGHQRDQRVLEGGLPERQQGSVPGAALSRGRDHHTHHLLCHEGEL